jgi:uncharacterized protein (DUF486 family)
MLSLIRLQFKTTFKNPATMMMVLMPLLLVSIFSTAFTFPDSQAYTAMIGNIITLNLVAVTMLTFGMSLFEMKKSILMKRIGASSITKPQMMIGLFI